MPSRSCQQANIPAHICSCGSLGTQELTKDTIRLAKEESKFLVDYINNGHLEKYASICDKRKFKSLRIFRKISANVYSVIFRTSPNDAIFDGPVFVEHVNNSGQINMKFQYQGTIERINLYGGTSKCIADNKLKPICYCKNLRAAKPTHSLDRMRTFVKIILRKNLGSKNCEFLVVVKNQSFT